MIKDPSGVQLIPFLAPRDLPLLRAWLDRPHVTRWWGDPEEALAHASQHPPAMHGIIALDGEPIGYVCWQSPSAEEIATAGLSALPPDHIDVDIFIGEEDCIGRGIGPQVLFMVLERLECAGVSSVGLATDVDNQRARRAYEKAGFRICHVFEEGGRHMCYFTRVPTRP
ncbi:MAG: GNAT family N-acetyltransferase [Gemmatimonadota bacterium]